MKTKLQPTASTWSTEKRREPLYLDTYNFFHTLTTIRNALTTSRCSPSGGWDVQEKDTQTQNWQSDKNDNCNHDNEQKFLQSEKHPGWVFPHPTTHHPLTQSHLASTVSQYRCCCAQLAVNTTRNGKPPSLIIFMMMSGNIRVYVCRSGGTFIQTHTQCECECDVLTEKHHDTPTWENRQLAAAEEYVSIGFSHQIW